MAYSGFQLGVDAPCQSEPQEAANGAKDPRQVPGTGRQACTVLLLLIIAAGASDERKKTQVSGLIALKLLQPFEPKQPLSEQPHPRLKTTNTGRNPGSSPQ